MDIPSNLQGDIARFEALGQWDRAELGRSLRRLGLSYGEIRELIPVPKGTLAGWCREIRLSEGQVAAIKDRRGPREGPRNTQWKRRREVEQIRAEAGRTALTHLRDPFWVAGTVLYWGEGNKTKRNLAVANADPALLQLFMRWTRQFHLPTASFVLALHLHAGNDEAAAKAYWQTQLGVTDFTKTYIKPSGTGHRKNHLQSGICRVYVRKSTNAWIRTMEWIDTLRSHQTSLANLSSGSLAQLAEQRTLNP